MRQHVDCCTHGFLVMSLVSNDSSPFWTKKPTMLNGKFSLQIYLDKGLEGINIANNYLKWKTGRNCFLYVILILSNSNLEIKCMQLKGNGRVIRLYLIWYCYCRTWKSEMVMWWGRKKIESSIKTLFSANL